MAMLFSLGRTVATIGARDLLERTGDHVAASKLLQRHAVGDWGDVCDQDKGLNDWALLEGGRLLSAYHVQVDDQDHKLWIITEADRSATTLLLPEEY